MKRFFEAFPTLQLQERIADQMEDIRITHIKMSPNSCLLKIYINGTRPLERQTVHTVEKEITKQIMWAMYPGQGGSVSILEHYDLSDSYTLSSLMETYRDSILLELKESDLILYQLFCHAQEEYGSDNLLKLTLVDSLVAVEKSQRLASFLTDLFRERFGIDADIRIAYREENGNHAKEANERRVEAEILRISKESESVTRESADEIAKKHKPEKGSGKKQGAGKKSDPNLIYGRDFNGQSVPICDILEGVRDVIVTGQICSMEIKSFSNGTNLILMDITDFTDTISVKFFPKDHQLPLLNEELVKGAFVTLKASTSIDKRSGELTLGYVSGIKRAEDNREKRSDLETEKRVELHCHTKMSDMDGVSDVKDIIRRAAD